MNDEKEKVPKRGKGERGKVFHAKETANAKTLAWGLQGTQRDQV